MSKDQFLLDIQNLSITFSTQKGSASALKDISLHIQPEESVGLVGESGSGKSVISLAIMGLLPQNILELGGNVFFKQTSLTHWILKNPQDQTDLHYRGFSVSMVFQDPMSALNPMMTVGAHLREALQLHNPLARESDLQQWSVQWLQKVGLTHPEQQMHQYPHQISGGMAQRVMIALALIPKPDLLIADEPTTALDATVQKQILTLIKNLQQEQKMALLLISHDLAVVAENCERIYVLRKGDLIEHGPTASIWTAPKEAYTQDLLSLSKPGVSIQEENIEVKDPKTVLQLKSISKHFLFKKNSRKVLHNISLDIHKGQTWALVGESGSGKSTLAKIIMGLVEPSSGSVVCYKENVLKNQKQHPQDWPRCVQMIFQDTSGALNPRRTVLQIVKEPLEILFSLSSAEIKNQALEILQMVGLDESFASRYPHMLSGGQRQRVGIARALIVNPDFIICDEPVSALDVQIQKQILDLLVKIQQQKHVGYLFISHDLQVVRHFAKNILVLNQGDIVEQGLTADIFKSPKHPYTQKLLASQPQGFTGFF